MRNKIKLYFIKLMFALLYTLCSAIIYFASSPILLTAANFFLGKEFLRLLILLGIPGSIVTVIIYRNRVYRTNILRCYRAQIGNDSFNIKREIKSIIKSSDFIAELFACITLLLIIFIPMTFYVAESTILIKFFTSTTLVIIFAVIFAFLDMVIWLFVRLRWRSKSILF